MNRPRLAPLAALALTLAAAPAGGQTPAPPGSAAAAASMPRPVLRAAPSSGTIRVDGVLDEAAWARADVARNFVQSYPQPGRPATERTEARVMYDDAALYVGVRLYDSHPDSIAAQLARRDASGIYSDWLHVMVDSYHDRRSAFRFSVNPRAVQKDVRHFDDVNEDLLWDAVWEVATRVDGEGWTAEYRIPLSQLRYDSQCRAAPAQRVAGGSALVDTTGVGSPAAVGSPAESAGVAGTTSNESAGAGGAAAGTCGWGLNIQRDIARRGERSSWSYTPQNGGGYVSFFGDLRGLDELASPRRLELLPYVSQRLTRAPGSGADPFYEKNDADLGVGADFRYGVTSGLTLTGTLNPDFGQVELDPAFVNLSQFEFQLPERRPFFVEGADIFQFGNLRVNNSFGGAQFFYSRRIGRAPQRTFLGEDVTYRDVPTQSTILGAAKLSGKTPGGWSVGVLDAVTDEEEGRFVRTDGTRGTTLVEPRSNYFVGRVRKDLRGGQTVVGGLLTNTVRDRGAAEFRDLLRGNATVAGLDFEHSWRAREWTMSGFVAGSRVTGSQPVILATQNAQHRLYGRPDADHLAVDPEATSLDGTIGALALAKSGGEHWTGSVAYQFYGPGFEANDIGFQTVADRRSASTIVFYRENDQTRHFRGYGGYAFTNHQWNYGGDLLFDSYNLGAYATLNNFWYVETQLRYNRESFSDRMTRGGPLARVPAQISTNGSITTDNRRPLVVGLEYNLRDDASGEYGREYAFTFDMRPTTSLRVLFEPSIDRLRNTDQFVLSAADPLATRTFGRRYLFADVDQTELSLGTRVNWTFTPRLSLELVAQPFVTAGEFYHFKEFREPGAFEFDRYGRDRGTIADEYVYARDPAGTPVDSSRVGYRIDPDGDPTTNNQIVVPEPNYTFRSLRGSAVMRWEYRPGSTLFLVWQQQRAGSYPFGSLAGDRDVSGLFREQAENVFLVKLSYWFSR